MPRRDLIPSASTRGWIGVAILTAVSLHLVVTLGARILHTETLTQDSAHYCEVAERWLAGDGLTSSSDRRGPADPRAFPQPFEAANRWPCVLAAAGWLTGEVPNTGMVLSLLSLLAALWLTAVAIARAFGTTLTAPAIAVATLVSHHRIVSTACLPLGDALSLCLHATAMLAIAKRRPVASCLWVAAAIALRTQNLALLFPLAWLLGRGRPAGRRLVLVFGIAAGLVAAGSNTIPGLLALLDPGNSDSLVRTLRFATLPLAIGIVAASSRPGVAPFGWLAAGHLLALLANPDPSGSHQWLWGIRHGWPLHLVVAAFATLALVQSRGVARLLVLTALIVAGTENLRHPVGMALRGAESPTATHRMIEHLRAHPLPESAVVFTPEADRLAYETGIRSVHSRGFPMDDPGLRIQLRNRGATHVLLIQDGRAAVRHHDRRMDLLRRACSATSRSVATFELDGTRCELLELLELR